MSYDVVVIDASRCGSNNFGTWKSIVVVQMNVIIRKSINCIRSNTSEIYFQSL